MPYKLMIITYNFKITILSYFIFNFSRWVFSLRLVPLIIMVSASNHMTALLLLFCCFCLFACFTTTIRMFANTHAGSFPETFYNSPTPTHACLIYSMLLITIKNCHTRIFMLYHFSFISAKSVVLLIN